MQQSYRGILLIGFPGSGKGTQGRILGTVPGFYYFSSGDMLRALPKDHADSQRVRQLINEGNFVPDELVLSLSKNFLFEKVQNRDFHPEIQYLILDGLPRTVPQAESLEEFVETVKILHLVCRDEQQLIQRLRNRAEKDHRQDDVQEDIIRHRLRIYEEETAPILNYYPADHIVEIDALRSPLEVLDQIIHALLPLQTD